jgi:soluble lytic murein transglycosylase
LLNKKPRYAVVIILLTIVALLAGFLYQQFYSVIQKEKYPRKFSKYVTQASREFNVPEPIIYATIKTESNFVPDAESSAGALGLMQLMPSTFEWLTTSVLKENLTPQDIIDPQTNIRYGTYMLSLLYKLLGDWETVFAAYNAGIGNVNSWLENELYSQNGKLTHIPFPETREYVQRQLSHIKKYENLNYTGD